MTDYVWSHLERRDLYLASRILADSRPYDGEWAQWASDTLIYHLEIYDDPRQGVGFFLRGDEVQLVEELGACLWAIIQADPFSAAALLAHADPTLRALASQLVERIEANGRTIPDLRRSLGAILAAEERQPPNWDEAKRLANDLLRHLAEPNTQCPEIAVRFLDDMDIRAKDEGYAEFQRKTIRRFVERGEFTDSRPIPWWARALAATIMVGALLWWLL